MYRANVFVYLRPSIQDPQGVVIGRTLKQLGFDNLDQVRTGRYFQVTVSADSREEAQSSVEKMCNELLANTVIEDFRIEVSECG